MLSTQNTQNQKETMKMGKKLYFDQSRDLIPLAFFKDKLIDPKRNLVALTFFKENRNRKKSRLVTTSLFREKIINKS